MICLIYFVDLLLVMIVVSIDVDIIVFKRFIYRVLYRRYDRILEY